MYYYVSHLQPVVESDELFHPILPSVRINMLVIMKKSNLTCACQATMSSHSMGSPSDSSPILLHFTFSRLGLRSLLRCRNPPLTPVPWSRSQLWWVRQCGGVRVRARVLCVGRRHGGQPRISWQLLSSVCFVTFVPLAKWKRFTPHCLVFSVRRVPDTRPDNF